MIDHTKAVAGFISSTVGGFVVAVVSWYLLKEPVESPNVSGLYFDQVGALGATEWVGGVTITCTVVGTIIGFILDD